MTNSETVSRVFPATLDTIEEVAQYLEEVLDLAGVSMMDSTRIQLAVEEAVTNVINHGYKGTTGDVSVVCETHDNTISITITDAGNAFDPTSIPPVDVTTDLEERKIGGLGVHLIKSVMDEVRYSRIDEKNRLTLVKTFIPE